MSLNSDEDNEEELLCEAAEVGEIQYQLQCKGNDSQFSLMSQVLPCSAHSESNFSEKNTALNIMGDLDLHTAAKVTEFETVASNSSDKSKNSNNDYHQITARDHTSFSSFEVVKSLSKTQGLQRSEADVRMNLESELQDQVQMIGLESKTTNQNGAHFLSNPCDIDKFSFDGIDFDDDSISELLNSVETSDKCGWNNSSSECSSAEMQLPSTIEEIRISNKPSVVETNSVENIEEGNRRCDCLQCNSEYEHCVGDSVDCSTFLSDDNDAQALSVVETNSFQNIEEGTRRCDSLQCNSDNEQCVEGDNDDCSTLLSDDDDAQALLDIAIQMEEQHTSKDILLKS